MPLRYLRHFLRRIANLCATPLHFRSQPPQLNCPPDTVLLPDFYVAKGLGSTFPKSGIPLLPCGSHLFSTVENVFPMPSYSKAPRGLFVLVQVGRIFTANSISPGNDSRQLLTHSAVRAGRNLPDKEFRSKPSIFRSLDYILSRLFWRILTYSL